MKQSKLLLTSALVGSVALAGSAFADISGDITTTIQLGSDDGAATSNGSDERIGSEVNIKYSSKADLDNGMTAGIKGKLEFQNGTADQEYEMTIGTDSAYLGIGSDGGNSIRSSALPFLGYVPGTLAEAVSLLSGSFEIPKILKVTSESAVTVALLSSTPEMKFGEEPAAYVMSPFKNTSA